MSLRSISLRWKLVAALVLPMLVVAGYLAVSIRTSTADRADARVQQEEVERFVAVASLSEAIGAESLVVIARDATDDDLAVARASTDAVMDELRSEELALSPDQLSIVEQRYGEVLELRETIGDTPFEIRLMAQTELRSGDLTMTGDITPALARLSALPSIVLADFEFDTSVGGSDTVELLDDYFLVQRYRADLGREVATLSRVSSLPSNLVDSRITELVATAISATDQSGQFLADLGSAELNEQAAPILSGAAFAQYEPLRTSMDALETGQASTVEAAQIQIEAASVDTALAEVADETIAELDSRSSDTVFRANRDLVLSALIGFWLLVLVGLVLRVLYRAIKSPIERLTEQAQQISEVELPEIVEQMRRGDIDTIPHVEEIPAETKDEIGDLVHAFNGMHRTAVELAAEQANSRRVVADMFVNLGRRNQRLVNRLLKGLTVLEQHEEDPDKLDSLYEIDHVATRMRRNAESLLVLAGAGQSRRWEKSVPLYDLARASLAEVENYERVQIDVADGPEIDGGIVADLTHLLAELVENALSFSPPSSPVELIARPTDDGLLIAVSDNGVGMPAEQMTQANRLIADAAEEDETPSEFLGHYVVGRLAARHGLRVELLEGPAGGVTARVFVPERVVAGTPEPLADAPSVGSGIVSEAASTVGEQPPRQPVAAVALDPLLDPASLDAAEPVAAPGLDPVFESAPFDIAEPVAAAGLDPLLDPASLDAAEPVAAAGLDPVFDPASLDAAEPVVAAGLDPVLESASLDATEPAAPEVSEHAQDSADSAPPVAGDADPAVDEASVHPQPVDPEPTRAPAIPEPESSPAPTGGPNPASFDWPSPFEVDPLTAEQRQPSASDSELRSPSEPQDDGGRTIPPMVPPTVGPLHAGTPTEEQSVASEPSSWPSEPTVPAAEPTVPKQTVPEPTAPELADLDVDDSRPAAAVPHGAESHGAEPIAPQAQAHEADVAEPFAPRSQAHEAHPAEPRASMPAVAEPPVPAPPMPSSPSLDATTEQLTREADDAVNDALSVFGVSRRTPGAQLPSTDLFASISGSMRLGSVDDQPARSAPSAAVIDAVEHITDLGDEEQVRFDLSGFQHGTHRADRELGDSAS